MDGNKLKWYRTRPETKLDILSLRLIEPVNYGFATAVDYQKLTHFQEVVLSR